MIEGLLTLLLIPLAVTFDALVLAAILWPCYAGALAVERKLYALGLRQSPPNGRSGIVAFAAILMGIPALIVAWGHLTGRLPP
jgi:hypothetical protein